MATPEQLAELRKQIESLSDEERAKVIEGYCPQCGKEGGCWCDYDSPVDWDNDE